jgi:hypothetical protein
MKGIVYHEDCQLDRIELRLNALIFALGKDFLKLMADINKILEDEKAEAAAIAALQAAVAVVANVLAGEATQLGDAVKLIADLKAQLAAGVPITQEQLDAIDAQVATNTANINGQVAGLLALVPPAPVPAPDPTAAP